MGLHGKLITLSKVFMGPQDPCRYDCISPPWKNYGRTEGPVEKLQTGTYAGTAITEQDLTHYLNL